MKKMKKMKYLALALAASTILGGVKPASASIVDNPYFNILGMVIVWGAGSGGTAPVVSDFALLTTSTGTAAADLIAANVKPVITGTFTAIPASAISGTGTIPTLTGVESGGVLTDNDGAAGLLDAADSYTAFNIDNSTTLTATDSWQSSFYVASNAAFDIYASRNSFTSTGFSPALTPSDIAYGLSISTSGTDGAITYGGEAAQDPSTGGTGLVAVTNLNDLSTTPTKIFDGGRKTAAAAGTIVAQSVRFNATYGLDYDMSKGAGSVTSTVTYTIYTP